MFLIAIYEQIKTMNGFSSDKILEIASQTLREESEAISGLINHLSNDFVETVFLMSKPELSHISSTIVRDLLKNNGSVLHLIPDHLNISL